MKHIKFLFIILFVGMLCGCTKDYGQLSELDNSIMADMQKDGIVTSCECPNVYVRPILWAAFLVDQKQTVGNIYTKKCQSPVNFKDAYNDKILMKCTHDKCKIYE